MVRPSRRGLRPLLRMRGIVVQAAVAILGRRRLLRTMTAVRAVQSHQRSSSRGGHAAAVSKDAGWLNARERALRHSCVLRDVGSARSSGRGDGGTARTRRKESHERSRRAQATTVESTLRPLAFPIRSRHTTARGMMRARKSGMRQETCEGPAAVMSGDLFGSAARKPRGHGPAGEEEAGARARPRRPPRHPRRGRLHGGVDRGVEGLRARRRPACTSAAPTKALHHLFRRGHRQRNGRSRGRPRHLHRGRARRGRLAERQRRRRVRSTPPPPIPRQVRARGHRDHAARRRESSTARSTRRPAACTASAPPSSELSDRLEVEWRARRPLPAGLFSRGVRKDRSSSSGEVRNRRGTKVRFHPDAQILAPRRGSSRARLFQDGAFEGVPLRRPTSKSAGPARRPCWRTSTPCRRRRRSLPGRFQGLSRPRDRGPRARRRARSSRARSAGRGSLEWAMRDWHFGGVEDGFAVRSLLQHDPHPRGRRAQERPAHRAAAGAEGPRRAHRPVQARRRNHHG